MIGTMQNARGPAVQEDAPDVSGRDRAVLAVAVAALVVLSLAPSLALKVTEPSSRAVITPPRLLWESEQKADGNRRPVTEVFDPGVIR
jgi:NADH:ubiquinone oxidoreductase subunit 4 (subunit M)